MAVEDVIVTAAADNIIKQILTDDGTYPNNDQLPVLLYQGVLNLSAKEPAFDIETLFNINHWGGSWRNGIYNFHHYHSTAHEVLGIYGGTAEVQLGGENGIKLSILSGDIVILPAGVAHKNLGASSDFRVVGAYPSGQRPDMCYGKPGERPQADHNIARVALPQSDPFYGSGGPLKKLWRK